MLTRHLRTHCSSLIAGAALAMLPFAGASAATYYDYHGNSCTNVQSCTANVFAAVQAGKTLLAERVTCAIRTPKSGVVNTIRLGRWQSGSKFFAGPLISPVQKIGSDTNYNYYLANAEVLFPIMAGYKPMVTVMMTTSVDTISVDCNVAGTTTP